MAPANISIILFDHLLLTSDCDSYIIFLWGCPGYSQAIRDWEQKGTLLYVASVVAVEKKVPSVTVVSFSSVVAIVVVGATVSIIEIFVNLHTEYYS